MWPWETAKQAIEERYNALKAQNVANKNLQQASAVSLAQKGWDPEMGIPRMGGNQTRFSELTPEEKNVITGANISLVGGLTTGVGARSQKYLDAVGKLATKELPAQQEALNVIKNEAQRQLTPQELNSVKDWSDQKLVDKIYKRLETERNAVQEAGSKAVDTMPNLLKKTDPLIEEAKKYKSAEEFVTEKLKSYRDAHRAPSADTTPVAEKLQNGGDFSLEEVAKGYHNQPSDYFDPRVGPRYYLYNDQAGMESATAIDNARRAIANGREGSIEVYRTVPKDIKQSKLVDYDWVTPSKEYAVNHGEARFGSGEYKIIKQEVKPNELWWDGNDIREWGYDSGKDTKKLTNIWNKAQSTLSDINTQYRGQHQIRGDVVEASNLGSIDNLIKRAKEQTGNGYISNYDRKDLKILEKIQGNPDAEIKIYRASPVNELNNGDWITTSKTYAQDIKKQNGGKVYEYTVKASDLKYPNDITELPSLARFSAFKYEPNISQSTSSKAMQSRINELKGVK